MEFINCIDEIVCHHLHLMESTDPQGPPGDVENDVSITGTSMPTSQTESELDDWSPVASSQLENSVRKVGASASRLLFLTVEYVEEPTGEYGRSAFSAFEPGAPFSPQQTSLSEFEHRVSPLDPNMSSAARYSPVYAITGTGTSALAVVTGEASSAGGTSTSSNPSSPFPSSQVASPIITSSPANALSPSPSSGNPYIDTTQGHATTVAHSFVNPSSPLQILSDTPTSTGEGLLRQVVTGTAYFRTTTSSSSAAGILGATPPHSPLQPPLTPTDNYVVSSSTGPLVDSVPATRADFHSNGDVAVAVAVTTSPGRVDSTSELLIQRDATQLVGGTTDETDRYHSISGAMKAEGGSVQLLISSSDGSSLVIEEGEEGDLRVRHSISRDGSSLPLDVTLNVTTDQQQDLIEAELLGTQVNGSIETQVRRLEHPLLGEDMDINLGVPSSEIKVAVADNYANILLDGQTAVEETESSLPRRSKRHQIVNSQDVSSDYSTRCEECCNSYEQGCPQHRVQTISDKPVPSRAWATLPASYLAINKVGTTSNGSPVHGVFARKTIPKRTQFGPIEGVLIKADEPHLLPSDHDSQLELLVESETGSMLKLDTACENSSNWMRFVRAAESFKDQNLILTEEIEHLWPCFECNERFANSEELQKHLNIHDTERTQEHVRKHHKNNGIEINGMVNANSAMKKKVTGPGNEWLCSHCSLTFTSASVLNLHTLAHAADNLEEAETITGLPSDFHSVYHAGEFLVQNGDVQCPQCTQEFPSKKELIEHVSAHGKLTAPQLRTRLRSVNPAKPWKCELCYKSFATEDRLQRHMLVHGAEESKPLQCEVCYKRFLNNSALACHIKIHTEKKIFECPICKAVFDQVLALKEHVHIHSENGLFTCPQCNKVFDEYSLIRKHIRAFHSDRKHTCSYCSKLFPTLDKLRMHMLRHSDHREFLCANCGKQFKRKDKLKEHMKRMHSAERELRLAMKPHRTPTAKKFMPKVQVSPTDYHRFIYKCHTCLLGFKRRGMLVNHLAKRHPDISPDSVPELNLPILKTTRDYYCQYCEKVYKSSSKRKAHILKNHPGAELPMSNRRKSPRVSKNPNSPGGPEGGKFLPMSVAPALPNSEAQQVVQLQSTTDNVVTSQTISIIPAEYQITGTEEALREYQESGIIIDTSSLKRPLKGLADGVSAELLTQAMTELSQMSEFRVAVGGGTNSNQDHYFKIVQTSSISQSGNAASPSTPPSQDRPNPTSPSPAVTTTSQLHHLLTSEQSYSLPSSPTAVPPATSPGPRTWTHANYAPYTAR
ncbi:hypothetical protein C0J52_09751 [Blattella germanica]|nr:hypothetical protein C0J52_09751 [Blattella germanica]